MAKQLLREVKPYAKLYRDTVTGIAWIEDGSSGCGFSVHSNIGSSGSVRGMRTLGYWGTEDRTVRSHGFIYNIDTFICEKENEFEMIVADECRCQGCSDRRAKKVIELQ